MIHILLVLDRNKSIGIELYNNKKIRLNADLLIGLVQALMLLGQELGESKGPLREAELGVYQISILSKDHLAYIVVQDSYDSEPFTRRILDTVLDEFHDTFFEMNFNKKVDNEQDIRNRVTDLLRTMKFKKSLLPLLDPTIELFNKNTAKMCETLFLADLDDGIVNIWNKPKKDGIIKILMELLSEIDPERSWTGSSALLHPRQVEINGEEHLVTHEIWFLIRIGLTDFCLLGRAYFAPGIENELLMKNLEMLSSEILNLVSHPPKVE